MKIHRILTITVKGNKQLKQSINLVSMQGNNNTVRISIAKIASPSAKLTHNHPLKVKASPDIS